MDNCPYVHSNPSALFWEYILRINKETISTYILNCAYLCPQNNTQLGSLHISKVSIDISSVHAAQLTYVSFRGHKTCIAGELIYNS